MKEIDIYQVDAFTSRLFGGNPAAVCPLREWLADDVLQMIAAENNLSETAFFIPEGDGFELRRFTPKVEIDMCGHATLATSMSFLIICITHKMKSVFPHASLARFRSTSMIAG